MKFEFDITQYISENGIKLVWDDDFKIKVKVENGSVLIQANAAGLRSLAYQLLILSECKAGRHFHYDEYNSLEEGSSELIVEKID